MNRKEGTIMGIVILATFMTGVFAIPEQQILNVFVTNQPQTHVGQDVFSLATVECRLGYSDPAFCWRNFSDGTSQTNFTVPVGTVFVVTDVDWVGISQASPGTYQSMDLVLKHPEQNYAVAAFRASAIVDQDGFAQGSEHLTTGFVISPTAQLFLSGCCFTSTVQVLMQGYLVNTV